MNFGFYFEGKNWRLKVETTNICDYPKGNPFKPQVDILDYSELQMKTISKMWYFRPFSIYLGKKVYY